MSFAVSSERDVRRQIDLAISRATVDCEFAQTLIADPTLAVQEGGCTPQQYRQLQQIHAVDLVDLAQQVHALFWCFARTPSSVEERIPLPAAAAR